jgi:hypothetical protein
MANYCRAVIKSLRGTHVKLRQRYIIKINELMQKNLQPVGTCLRKTALEVVLTA